MYLGPLAKISDRDASFWLKYGREIEAIHGRAASRIRDALKIRDDFFDTENTTESYKKILESLCSYEAFQEKYYCSITPEEVANTICILCLYEENSPDFFDKLIIEYQTRTDVPAEFTLGLFLGCINFLNIAKGSRKHSAGNIIRAILNSYKKDHSKSCYKLAMRKESSINSELGKYFKENHKDLKSVIGIIRAFETKNKNNDLNFGEFLIAKILRYYLNTLDAKEITKITLHGI